MTIKSGTIPAIVGISMIAIVATATVVNGAIYGQSKTSVPEKTENTPKIEEKTKTETGTIPYESKTVEDSNLEYGKTEVRTKGVAGEITYTYKVTYTDGKETSRELVNKETTKQPVNEVVAKGTKIVWHCVDTTSYDRNPYNDNKCTSSTGEVIYTYDSDAKRYDPSYTPSSRGARRYNF